AALVPIKRRRVIFGVVIEISFFGCPSTFCVGQAIRPNSLPHISDTCNQEHVEVFAVGPSKRGTSGDCLVARAETDAESIESVV
ncbi:MAG: hypothetical protein OSB41_07415, partial [Kiritimatiellae bacterium]|nr:hypothetical protein [Kiritimatiellia bacterium]